MKLNEKIYLESPIINLLKYRQKVIDTSNMVFIKKFYNNNQDQIANYSLKSYIEHSGDINYGNYKAICLKKNNDFEIGDWWIIDNNNLLKLDHIKQQKLFSTGSKKVFIMAFELDVNN